MRHDLQALIRSSRILRIRYDSLRNIPTGKYQPKKNRVPTQRFHGISARIAAIRNESQW
jgi:hypothetical protein